MDLWMFTLDEHQRWVSLQRGEVTLTHINMFQIKTQLMRWVWRKTLSNTVYRNRNDAEYLEGEYDSVIHHSSQLIMTVTSGSMNRKWCHLLLQLLCHRRASSGLHFQNKSLLYGTGLFSVCVCGCQWERVRMWSLQMLPRSSTSVPTEEEKHTHTHAHTHTRTHAHTYSDSPEEDDLYKQNNVKEHLSFELISVFMFHVCFSSLVPAAERSRGQRSQY